MGKLLFNMLNYTIKGFIWGFIISFIIAFLTNTSNPNYVFVALVIIVISAITGAFYGATKEENFERPKYTKEEKDKKILADKKYKEKKEILRLLFRINM